MKLVALSFSPIFSVVTWLINKLLGSLCSSVIWFSAGKLKQARKIFSMHARCLKRAFTTGVPGKINNKYKFFINYSVIIEYFTPFFWFVNNCLIIILTFCHILYFSNIYKSFRFGNIWKYHLIFIKLV